MRSAPASSSDLHAQLNADAVAAPLNGAVVDISTNLAKGTGMVLSPVGFVLTNYHVIENAHVVTAQIDGTGPTYTAIVLGYSSMSDVALLQLEGASGLKTVTIGSSSDLSVAEPIVAIGNENGAGGPPKSEPGTVIGLDRTIVAGSADLQTETLHGMIEINAPIAHGDSGGPLVNSASHVVGIITAETASTGHGYAIGVDQALAIVSQIESGEASATVQIEHHSPDLH